MVFSPGILASRIAATQSLAGQRNHQAAAEAERSRQNMGAALGGVSQFASSLAADAEEQKTLEGLKVFGEQFGIPRDDPAWQSPEAAKVRLNDAIAQRNATTQRTNQLNDRADSQAHAERMMERQDELTGARMRAHAEAGWQREDEEQRRRDEQARALRESQGAQLRELSAPVSRTEPSPLSSLPFPMGGKPMSPVPKTSMGAPRVSELAQRIAAGRSVGGGAVEPFDPGVAELARRLAATDPEAPEPVSDLDAARAEEARARAEATRRGPRPRPLSPEESAKIAAETKLAEARAEAARTPKPSSGPSWSAKQAVESAQRELDRARSAVSRLVQRGVDPSFSAMPDYGSTLTQARTELAAAQRAYDAAVKAASAPSQPPAKTFTPPTDDERAELEAAGYTFDPATGGWIEPAAEDE